MKKLSDANIRAAKRLALARKETAARLKNASKFGPSRQVIRAEARRKLKKMRPSTFAFFRLYGGFPSHPKATFAYYRE